MWERERERHQSIIDDQTTELTIVKIIATEWTKDKLAPMECSRKRKREREREREVRLNDGVRLRSRKSSVKVDGGSEREIMQLELSCAHLPLLLTIFEMAREPKSA